MRPRANDRHFAHQYIHQLGELVDIRPPQNTANARHARIVLDSLREVAAIFDRRHRSELKDLDDFIVVPMPGLTEEYGTARIKPDCERNREREWREHQQGKPRDAYVKCTLRESIERRQWRGEDPKKGKKPPNGGPCGTPPGGGGRQNKKKSPQPKHILTKEKIKK